MKRAIRSTAIFVGASALAAGGFFAVVYLMVCEFARAVE